MTPKTLLIIIVAAAVAGVVITLVVKPLGLDSPVLGSIGGAVGGLIGALIATNRRPLARISHTVLSRSAAMVDADKADAEIREAAG